MMILLIVATLVTLVGLAVAVATLGFVAANNRRDIEFLLKRFCELEQEWAKEKHHLATMEWVRETTPRAHETGDLRTGLSVMSGRVDSLAKRVVALTPKKPTPKPAKKTARKKARK